MIYTVVLIIFIALLFDYSNGFHDSANSIATVVSTRVLTPGKAVMMAAFFNFVAAFLFNTHVANTIGKGLIDVSQVDVWVIMAGLMGAVTWNIITWYFGLPTSSSHALIGAYAGAAVSKAGWKVIIASGWTKTLVFIVVSPLLGMILGLTLMVAVYWIFRNFSPSKVDKYFRRLQLASASLYSLSHGLNDAQKTMGIIFALLLIAFPQHYSKEGGIPIWVILAAHAAIALGTLSGGWRIVKTMGSRITKLKPVGGFCAETAGGITVLIASGFGIPVSTTHTITGAIVGVGATTRLSAVRWGVVSPIVWAWVLTIPMAGLIASLAWHLIHFIIGQLGIT
jgi:PiT family inorganic phosphate transporter